MLFALFIGCPWVGPEVYADRVMDADGDAVRDERFGGRDCADGNPAIGDCDVDGDGHRAAPFGDDCDDTDGAVSPSAPEICNGIDDDCDGLADVPATMDPARLRTFYMDADGDGYGSEVVLACEAPPDTAERAGDCDDANAAVAPDVPELCDAIDHDCDGDPTAGAIDQQEWHTDADGDGVGAGPVVASACEAPAGTGPDGDCDDADPDVSPFQTERCNGFDDDCDGQVDQDDGDVVVDRVWRLDIDGDTYGAPGTEIASCSTPGTGYVVNAPIDCDDSDPLVYTDRSWYPDTDGDGYGDADPLVVPIVQCFAPPGTSPSPTDCDDTAVSVHPGQVEVCNTVDDDCDGQVDEGTIGQLWFADVDGDGFGDSEDLGGSVIACAPPGTGSFTLLPGDCDDTDADVSPIADELCNGYDDDCDTLVDDLDTDVVPRTSYFDGDGDGYGRTTVSVESCEVPSGFVELSGDCDDTDAEVYRLVTLVDGADAVDLQEVVDTTCEGGGVLFTGTVVMDGLQLTAREIIFASASIDAPATLTPPLAGASEPAMLAVPPRGKATLQGLQITRPDGAPTDWTPFADTALIDVGALGAELRIVDASFTDMNGGNQIVHIQGGGSVIVSRTTHDVLRTGSRGIYGMEGFSSLRIEDSTFDDVQTRAVDVGVPVLVDARRPSGLTVLRAQVTGSALDAGTHLFEVTSTGKSPLTTATFTGTRITDSGMALSVDDHPVDVVRNRWLRVAAQNDPNAPLPSCAPGQAALREVDAVRILGDEPVRVVNTELIGSGSICVQDVSGLVGADLSLQNDAIASPPRAVVRAPASGPTCDGFFGRPSVPFRALDSVFIDHGDIARVGNTAAAIRGAFTSNRIDDASSPPEVMTNVVIVLGTCSAATGNGDTPVADMELIAPEALPASLDTYMLFPWEDFCTPGHESPLVDAGVGPAAGQDADPGWLQDVDRDGVADTWERFWYGDLSRCERTAYDAGTLPDPAAPACATSTPISCP